MKQAKIICTLGTTTDSQSMLEKMVESGMTGVRMNTAYATIADYSSRIDMVREVSAKMGTYLDIMLDVKGPQVRLGNFERFRIETDAYVYIDFPIRGEPESSENEIANIRFNKNFSADLKEGDYILIENGQISAKVESICNSGALLKIADPGEGILHKYMGVNVPGVYLNVPKLSEKDKDVIRFGLDKGVDRIALSFVRDTDDVRNCYDFMKNYSAEKSSRTELCLKIEDNFGVKNLTKILDYTRSENIRTSVMVARGDLFVELGQDELPFAQDYIVNTCKKYDVPVMVGTGILSSMQHSTRPSRAEVCDVYNILESDVDTFMLSGETSYGDNPDVVVKTLSGMASKYYTKKFVESGFK